MSSNEDGRMEGQGSPRALGESRAILETRSAVVVRLAGDSGDGMQLAGMQLTDTSAVLGNDIATMPDFPAEIRAPAGSVAGVSGFQVNFASEKVHTPGDHVNALIAMNPAAFRAHIGDVEQGGTVIVDESEFDPASLRKAGYEAGYDPLEDETYQRRYKLFKVPISRLNAEELAETGMGARVVNRCKNMYALGLVYWLYERPLDTTIKYIEESFGRKKKQPEVARVNIQALKAGYYFGETAELFPVRYQVPKASIPAGRYRKVTGNEALAMGLITGGKLAGKHICYCSYPITPASEILHYLAGKRHFGVKTFQAEDEIAAATAAIGASFAGGIGVTGTSGPGFALVAESLGLATMTELPLIVVDVQRAGPSTGLPTKTEQADLLMALFGRNGDCPLVVLAPRSPADCFEIGIEAVRISLEHMVPVVVLSEGYLANGAEGWRLPDPSGRAAIDVRHAGAPAGDQEPSPTYEPFDRDSRFVRPWALPGTAGVEHRIGGLEKAHRTGEVSYDPENHQLMTELRRAKVERIAERIEPIVPTGDSSGGLLVLGWGGTYGAILTAVERARAKGHRVSAAHLRHLNPLPKNLGEVLSRFERVLVPELNDGQLRLLIRGRYLIDARGLNKVQGKPFLVEEIEQAVELMSNGGWGAAESLVPRQGKVRAADGGVRHPNHS